MLPQHGGVPNLKLRLSGPILLLLALVLITGLMLTFSSYTHAEPGDVVAQNRTKLSLIITLLLSFFILLAGTGRWWHPHLWRQGNSQRHRRRGHRSRSYRR
ncbi:MAG: hypothetical protein PHP93_00020 [Kiritimatiellales bacterium]|nr:hypothetical protein [Kiritimatiellales bacterium]